MDELEDVKTEKVTITIKGKERELRFGFSAWAELERKYGNFQNFSMLEEDMKARPFETLPQLVYIGLVDKSGVTKENCLDEYSMADIQELMTKVMTAFTKSLPQDDKKKVARKK